MARTKNDEYDILKYMTFKAIIDLTKYSEYGIINNEVD